ncbi:unannotated protein [freshwater metagenome]|uniref:Unannotated protein n=1 Tax=freshwater metagenome TaxID=449393 RepID=A0A6J6J369_9ZZZZ
MISPVVASTPTTRGNSNIWMASCKEGVSGFIDFNNPAVRGLVAPSGNAPFSPCWKYAPFGPTRKYTGTPRYSPSNCGPPADNNANNFSVVKSSKAVSSGNAFVIDPHSTYGLDDLPNIFPARTVITSPVSG